MSESKFVTIHVTRAQRQKLSELANKANLSYAQMLEVMCDYFARIDFTVTKQHVSVQVKSDLGIPTSQTGDSQ